MSEVSPGSDSAANPGPGRVDQTGDRRGAAVPDEPPGGVPENRADTTDFGSRTVSGISWQVGANLVEFIAQFGVSIALARMLFPDDFGVVAIATIATGFASTLTDLGLGPALVQRKEVARDHIRSCFTFSTLSAVAMGLLLFAAADPISDLFREPRAAPVLRVLSLTFPLSGLTITSRALLARRLRFEALVKIQLVASLLGPGLLSVFLAWVGFGYWSLVWGRMSQVLIAALLTYGVARHNLRPLFSSGPFRDLFGFSFGMSLTSTVNFFALQGDYFVIGRLMDSASLGFYTRAYSLMQLPMRFIGRALSRVMFPVAARVQHQPERFRRAFLATFRLSMALSLASSLVLAILAPELIVALYGDRWAGTVPLLEILALFGVFRMTYNSAAAFVRAKGQVYRLLASQVCYAGLVLGGSWFGASVAGLEGVAWGVSLAIMVMWGMVVGFAVRAAEVPTKIFLREIAAVALPSLALAAGAWAVASSLRSAGAGGWSVLLATGSLFASLFGVYLLFEVRRIDHPAIDRILERLPGVSKWLVPRRPTGET